MTKIKRNLKLKGFTLVEMIVAMAIIGALAGLLIPTMFGFVKDAKRAAAITDARIIKEAVEFSLVNTLPQYYGADSASFNKVLWLSQEGRGSKMGDRLKNGTEHEMVGAFTNFSWSMYKRGELNPNSKSQAIDLIIAKGLDDAFTEEWKMGAKANPMAYNSNTKNCAQYLKDKQTNFGLIVVYDTMGFVRMMQVYRKGVLVTYVNGTYVVNTSDTAHFVGEGTWDTIWADSGESAPEEFCQINLANGQIKDNGQAGGWY